MSYATVAYLAGRVKDHSDVLDGKLDRWIESLALHMSNDVIQRGNATDSDIYNEYNHMNASHMGSIMLAYGIPLDVVISHDVSARDYFITQYKRAVNEWING